MERPRESPSVSFSVFLAGRRQLYATPTSDQLGRCWKELKRALRDPIEAGVFVKNETNKTIELPYTEQQIRLKTAWNADDLRGDYADDLYFDEWQLMNEDAWEVVGAPMLMDNDGDAVFIYTPPSMRSRSVTKANDPRHAPKLFKKAEFEGKKEREDARKNGVDLECARWATFHFSSRDNPFISATALQEISKDMTALAVRQEIEAEDVEEMPGALWKLVDIERYRVGATVGDSKAGYRIVRLPDSWARKGVGVDPSGGSNEVGIIGGGTAMCDCKGYLELHGFVLADFSLVGSPKTWGDAVSSCYKTVEADRVYGERNFGGDMVENTIKQSDKNIHYEDVVASRGKAVRAEPVSALYEKGMIHHINGPSLAKLENEMVTWVPGISKWSPNRVDAVTWLWVKLLVGTSAGSLAEVSSYAPSHLPPIFAGFRNKVL